MEIKRIEVEIEEIQGCFPAPIVAWGDSFYLRLDPRWIRFWNFKLGDWIQVSATTVRRLEDTS